MISYFESPTVFGKKSLFLGGGITGCPDWQNEVMKSLREKSSDLAIVNPRKASFDISKKEDTLNQIKWEYQMLRRVDAIMFWFAKETIQPIALFELGAHLMIAGKTIFIGMNPEYPRRIDVEVQTSLIRPDLKIVYSLEDIVDQIILWEKNEYT